MEIIENIIKAPNAYELKCIDMHTTGQATRIVYSGFPHLVGTLLEQREEALDKFDDIRSGLMLEPRGHKAMYGAILCRRTERTESGEADIGVLFCHNEGWSTMCGHATIALGRFLVDVHDECIFAGRNKLTWKPESNAMSIRLHAPCGIIHVEVPVLDEGQRSDPTRPVSFISVPSFAAAMNMEVPIPESCRWPQLKSDYVVVDLAYGGTFYCMVPASRLGFSDSLVQPDLKAIEYATAQLKKAFNLDSGCVKKLKHPAISDVEFLYSVIVVDSALGEAAPDTKGGEFGLCFFADSQLDRSPTGSAVSARVALAYAKGDMAVHDTWTYHSLISLRYGIDGAFVGKIYANLDEELNGEGFPPGTVSVEVQGKAFYTGAHRFIVEMVDPIGQKGFLVDRMEDSSRNLAK